MDLKSLTQSESRRILKAVATGSTPAEFAHILFVGQTRWFDTAIAKMLETAEDQDFEIRFIRGKYGSGKTHFMYCLDRHAGQSNWATSIVLLKRDVVELDQFGSFVNEVVRTLVLPNGQAGVAALLESAFAAHAARYGIVSGRTVPLSTLNLSRQTFSDRCSQVFISPPFLTALRAAYAARLDGAVDQVQRLTDWLSGSESPVSIDPAYSTSGSSMKLRALGPHVADEHLRVIAHLCQFAALGGLYIGVDELEIIGRLPARRKANSFQTLRALVDQNHSRKQPPATCIYLAATPEMFEDPDKFPSYKALQDRIENLPQITGKATINYRANVIDLDRTQLEYDDLLSLAQSLLSLHERAYGAGRAEVEAQLPEIVSQVIAGRYVMARPRLLCRCVTDLLNGETITDLRTAIAAKAKDLYDRREKELEGR